MILNLSQGGGIFSPGLFWFPFVFCSVFKFSLFAGILLFLLLLEGVLYSVVSRLVSNSTCRSVYLCTAKSTCVSVGERPAGNRGL